LRPTGSITILYPIIDTAVCSAHTIDPVELAAACVRGGARILQIRAKQESGAEFLALTDRIVAVAREFGARVIVNDRADIARLAGADGVHVGQTDVPVEQAMAIVGAGRIVGLSTHDRDQIDRAVAGPASYVAVGPTFRTATKETGYEPRGLDLVGYAAGRGKPVVAIGGITLDRAPSVMAAGASAVAVISDLLTDGDPERRVRAFVAALPARAFNV
jgi:thiamine-phosphate pyrophosphorylase